MKIIVANSDNTVNLIPTEKYGKIILHDFILRTGTNTYYMLVPAGFARLPVKHDNFQGATHEYHNFESVQKIFKYVLIESVPDQTKSRLLLFDDEMEYVEWFVKNILHYNYSNEVEPCYE